jgi:hypothetical protein
VHTVRFWSYRSFAFPELKTLLQFSSDWSPGGSLPVFTAGQILNPYPFHYSKAFAFSTILYLPCIVQSLAGKPTQALMPGNRTGLPSSDNHTG